MIEHLRGREKALAPLGWTGREAEWIALVCLHSGVFTRAQFCFYFKAWRNRAQRFVESLIDRRFAIEAERPVFAGGALACRISNKRIYRALGAVDIRHRKDSGLEILWRRLLSLDYVLEHPEWAWLPTEPEKVSCFEALGLSRDLLPRREYRSNKGATRKRYFALKLPVAVDTETATFAYVDPGHETNRSLKFWGEAHRRLWVALRGKGLQVRVVVIAKDHQALGRIAGVLKAWADDKGGRERVDPSVTKEMDRIKRAIGTGDQDVLRKYGGLNAAMQQYVELNQRPKVKTTTGRTIDGHTTWIAERLIEVDGGL